MISKSISWCVFLSKFTEINWCIVFEFSVKLTIAQTVTLSPGPTVTVLVNSPVTFSCTTTYSMRFLFIRDSTELAGTTAVTLGNLKGVCSTLSLDSDYVVNCDTVIGPYNFTIKSVTSKYHNSNITCTVQYGSSTSIDIASAVTTILVKGKVYC